ncbi:MAG: DUF952 domain-containing protein [Parvibaculaceae bacterium]
MAVVYKILRKDEWDKALQEKTFLGSAIDRRDGFIHLSTASQLRETARRHFAGQTDLLLVGFDEGVLAPKLKWETSRGGALFPHVYGEIDPWTALSVDELPLREDEHMFPEGLGE